MRFTNFSSTSMRKDGEAVSKGLLHDITLQKTEDGYSVTATARHGGNDAPRAEFTADNFDDAWDYAEAFERAVTRELATTGIQGYIARIGRDKTTLISENMVCFSRNGAVPQNDHQFAELDTRNAEAAQLYSGGRYDSEPVDFTIYPEKIDRLTWQADMAARDGLLSPQDHLHIDDGAAVIGRFLARSGLGAVEGEFESFTAVQIPLPLLGKDTKIELCMDAKGDHCWKLHDKQLEKEHYARSDASYNQPEGPLNVASLYHLHQIIDDIAVERDAGGWSEERYFRDMTRAAANLDAEALDITNPDKPLLMHGEVVPEYTRAEPGLNINLKVGH